MSSTNSPRERTSKVLQRKLEAALGYPVATPTRTRAGRHQVGAFAWTWMTKPAAGGINEIGSCVPMSYCAKAEKLRVMRVRGSVAMYEVFPEGEKDEQKQI